VILGKRKRAANQPKAPPTNSSKPRERIRSYRIMVMAHSALGFVQTNEHINLENDPSPSKSPVV
jgi:hypothetical protein